MPCTKEELLIAADFTHENEDTWGYHHSHGSADL